MTSLRRLISSCNRVRLARFVAALAGVCCLAACSKTVEWKEEVQLNDGRTIVVKQKRRCEGGDYRAKTRATCISAKAWLTFSLPEFSKDEITWQSSLSPMVLNVHLGRLYVVGYPPHAPAFREYGATNPPYFGFVWKNDQWVRIPFEEIPPAIYDNNLLIENIPKNKTDYLSIGKKRSEEENGDPRYLPHSRRIDPNFVMKPH